MREYAMNIGFDLDRVFINTTPFIPYIVFEKFYRKKANGVLLYRIPKKPEQFLRYIMHYPVFRPIMKNNLELLEQMAKEKKDKFYLVSSRFGFLKKPTSQLVERLGFNDIFDGIYFNYTNEQPHEFKNEQIKKLKIERYIDDDLRLLQYLAKHNPKTNFYWFNNKEQRKLTRNLYAVTSIQPVFEQ